MKKTIIGLSLLMLASFNAYGKNVEDNSNVYKIDAIIAVIPSPEGNEVITQSELDRPAIDGTMRTLKDLVRSARLYLEAKKYGMLPSEEDITSHLNMIKRENNMTHDDVVKLFDTAGYSFEEGRRELGRMSAINTLLSVKIHSRVLVPEREVRAYYDANPEYLEAAYELQHGIAPFDENQAPEDQRKKIEALLHAGKPVSNIEWGNPFWIEIGDLAEDKMFITQMKPNEVRLSQELPNGFEFFKLLTLKERRLKTFEERYSQIADILRRPRYERLFTEFEQHLEATMPVIYMDVPQA